MLDAVRQVYCLVRAHSTVEADDRLRRSMRARHVYDGLFDSARAKLIALPFDLSQANLGLGASTYELITSQVTEVIHCAWSVNFNLQLSSFEKSNIAGLVHLIDLCLKAKRPNPASFNFCSSVSTVMHNDSDEIQESLPGTLSAAQDMGYAQSKLVGEHICANASKSAGIQTRVLRIGQIIGDTQHGIWNATEAIPLIFQCATTIGALPKLDESLLWLPVDIVAQAVIDISFLSPTAFVDSSRSEVFNIVSPHAFHWTNDLLPHLRRAGLAFKELAPRDWLQRLQQSSNRDPEANPPIKLLDFYAGKYETEQPRRRFVWHTARARAASAALAGAMPVDEKLVKKMIDYFRQDCWTSQSGGPSTLET